MTAAERLQRRGGKGDVVDRRVVEGFEPPLQPARRDAGVPLRILLRDQRRQVEQVDECRAWDLGAQRRLGDEEVAVLDRSLKDRPWVTLRRDPALRFWGRTATRTLPSRRLSFERLAGAQPAVLGLSASTVGRIGSLRSDCCELMRFCRRCGRDCCTSLQRLDRVRQPSGLVAGQMLGDGGGTEAGVYHDARGAEDR